MWKPECESSNVSMMSHSTPSNPAAAHFRTRSRFTFRMNARCPWSLLMFRKNSSGKTWLNGLPIRQPSHASSKSTNRW